MGLAGAWLAGQPAFAEDKPVHHREAHVHGLAHLNVTLENGRLDMELVTPAANIVGFEHKPRTTEQRQALDTAMAVLRTPEQVFALPPAAGCQATVTAVDTSLLDEEAETEGQDDKAHSDHAGHDHDEQAHGEEEHDEEPHAEIHGSYTFACAKPDDLGFIEVLLFQRFPATEDLEVQWVGPQGQSRRKLTAAAARLSL
jgi:hypothetical protein